MAIKSLIIYQSFHHQNTQKVAVIMADILGATLINVSEARSEDIKNYDLIGFGSGIYFWQHHQQLINFVKNLEKFQNKKAFIFSTSGLPGMKNIFHRPLKKLLAQKGFGVIGEFNCLGRDSVGPLKYFGGINKKRPNEKDLEKAKNFIQKLIK